MQAPVTNGDNVTTIASSIQDAINAVPTLPFTASSSAGVVTLTARHKGLCGNEIPVSLNYYGFGGGEVLPAGVQIAVATGTAGTGAPVLTGAVAAMADEPFDYIGLPFNDTASVNTLVRIQRDVTTYRKNAYGVADNSYLDSETLHTSAYVLRKLKSVITSKYGRHKLASDGTRFGPGQAIVTPAVIKGELLATYRQLECAGIVENYELFKQYLVVERDASDPNRLNTLFPPDYVNQLRVFAVVNQFRLQYSEESA